MSFVLLFFFSIFFYFFQVRESMEFDCVAVDCLVEHAMLVARVAASGVQQETVSAAVAVIVLQGN